jgi:predicted transcriptional regulator
MSSPLHCAPHDATLTTLQEMFLGLFVRHIPIKKKEKFIGMVSIGDVLRANLLEKDQQIKELNSMASWQYYENWGWERKKR